MHPSIQKAGSLRSRSEDSPSDEALLLGLGRGDEGAGTSFVRRYQRRVYGLARSIVGDPNQAEEVAREALIRAWRHADSWDPRRGSVSTWVLTMTRNLAVDALRRKGAQPADPRVLMSLDQPAHASKPDEAATVNDEAKRVRSALFDVPVEGRRALVFAAFYGLTAQEISQAEAISLGTAKARVRAGLTKVGSLLGHDETAQPELRAVARRLPSSCPNGNNE